MTDANDQHILAVEDVDNKMRLVRVRADASPRLGPLARSTGKIREEMENLAEAAGIALRLILTEAVEPIGIDRGEIRIGLPR